MRPGLIGKVLLHVQGHSRLEAAETEIEIVVVEIGTGEKLRVRPAPAGQGVEKAPAGIGQAEDLPGLVEGLAGRVIDGVPELESLHRAPEIVNIRVAAGDKKPQRGKFKLF